MDHFRALTFLVLLLCVRIASAEGGTCYTVGSFTAPSASAACAAFAASKPVEAATVESHEVMGDGSTCALYGKIDLGLGLVGWTFTQPIIPGPCGPDEPDVPSPETCQGLAGEQINVNGWGHAPASVCLAGCGASKYFAVSVPTEYGGSMYWSFGGIYTVNGQTCTANDDPTGGPSADDRVDDPHNPLPGGNCPPNTSKGEVNGQPVCIPDQPDSGNDGGGGTGGTGGDGGGTGGTGGTGGDGGGTGGTGGTGGGGDGTGGTGGTGGDGGGTGGGGSGNGNGDGEGNGSSFSGSCMGGFSCQGDALQCAIAREQHRRNCEIDAALTDDYGAVGGYSSSVSDSNVNGSNPLTDRLTDNSAGGDVSGMLDTSSATGSGSCISDTTFTFKGDSFSIPWSEHCNLFLWLGNILVMISLLIAAFIIKGGVK